MDPPVNKVPPFQHDAMKTTFSLRLMHPDAQRVKDAANDCIQYIDQIEDTLSRYVSCSDVSQINAMQSGDTRFISELAYECIRTALEVNVASGGLFDITLGKQIEHRKNEADGDSPPLEGQLMLDPDRPAIHCIQAGREIDLGGIGKGFALDKLRERLAEWGIESGLLSAGASTQLAFGQTAWPIELTGTEKNQTIQLKNQALSASGTQIQGSHIVSPRETDNYTYPILWVLHDTAAQADAWSTACLLMNAEELAACRKEITLFLESDVSL